MVRFGAVVFLALFFTGCATSFRPSPLEGVKLTGPTAFSFGLSPEQCLVLKKERRTYRATEQTSTYVAGAGAVLTGIFIFALKDNTAAQAATSGATLLASGTSVFAGSQVESIDGELTEGGCTR